MDRHSLMFQEALFIMNRLPNYYNRPKEELCHFRLGFMHKESRLVKVIPSSRENDTISQMISATDFFTHDLIMLPFSQLPPDIDSHDNLELPNMGVYDATGTDSQQSRAQSRPRSALEAAREHASMLVSEPEEA